MAAPKASAAPAGLGSLEDDLDAPTPAAGAGAGAAGFGGGFGAGMPPIGVPLPAMPVTGVPILSKAISAASAPSTGILQLQLKLDYPAKVLFTKLDAKTTVGQLKEECGKAFGLKGEELRRHQFHTVSYGRSPSQLGVRDKVGDAATLSEEGVRDRGTVLLVAPVDLKPVRDFEVKKKAEEEDDDDADNKYKGLKPSTIVKVMQMAKGRDELVCLEYFDMNASKAMRAPEWLQLEQKRVMQLIQRSTLNIKEGELFEHVVAWGKAEAKRQNLDTTPDNLRKVLANLLGHIRFPCMGMDEVATKVTPSGILTGEQMLQVFTYLGLSKDKAAAMKMPFPTVPRVGRRLPNHFTWDPNYKHYSVQLSDKNMTASTNDTNNWQNVAGSVELKKGVHEWEVVLQQYDQQNGYNVVIGVVPSYWNNWSNPSWIGASAAAPGWAYICGNGYKCSQTQGQQYYGAAAAQGGVVKVRLDLDKHTIEFSVNGASQGVAFHDVYGPVRAAVSMCRPQKFQLRFPNRAAAADD